MIDERSEKIMSLMHDEGEGEDIIPWNWNKIKKLEFNDYDSLRIFRMLCNAGIRRDSNNSPSKFYLGKLDSNQTKLFMLDEKLKHLLFLTKPSKIKEELKLPFESFFIDFIHKEEDFILFGLQISYWDRSHAEEIRKKGEEILGKNIFEDNYICNKCTITTYAFSKEKKDWFPIDLMVDLENHKFLRKIKTQETAMLKKLYPEYYSLEKKVSKLIVPLIINLLLFLNEPRVSIYIRESNNERRVKKGLIPIPSLLKTKIEVGLESYIEKIYFTGLSHSKLGFSFWVRGHWRNFSSERFVNMKGKKIWIAPHISGEGIMPPQTFEVRLKDKQNQSTPQGEELIKV